MNNININMKKNLNNKNFLTGMKKILFVSLLSIFALFFASTIYAASTDFGTSAPVPTDSGGATVNPVNLQTVNGGGTTGAENNINQNSYTAIPATQDSTNINPTSGNQSGSDFVGPPAPTANNSGGLIPCDGTPEHPCNFSAAVTLINNAIQWFIGISIAIASITFMIAGAQILMNPSNPGKREDAIEMFKKTAIGIIIVLIAWLIVHTILITFVNPNVNATRFLQ